MKIIIGHLMCSLLFKMMMLIVHAWLTSFFPPVVGYIQLYGILGGGEGGLTCTWRVRWGYSRIKLLKETDLGVNPCPPLNSSAPQQTTSQ